MVDIFTGVFSFALAETAKVVRQALQMGSMMAPAKPAAPAATGRALEYYAPASLKLAPQHPPAPIPAPISPPPEHMAPGQPIAGFRVEGGASQARSMSAPGPAPAAAVYAAAPPQAPGWGPMP